MWTDYNVNLDLATTATAPMTVQETIINTFTNAPKGYKLYLQMQDNNTSLTMRDTTSTIPSINTTPTNATALTPNTWGYAINGKDYTGVPAPWTNTTHSTGTSMPANQELFAGVPAANSDTGHLIQETTTANGPGGTDEQDLSQATKLGIYYGIRASNAMPTGDYIGTVVYTAIAEEELPIFYKITTMQEMTMSVCDSVPTPLPSV